MTSATTSARAGRSAPGGFHAVRLSDTLYDVRKLLWTGLLATAALAQTASPKRTVFEGKPSLSLANGKLELTVLVQGTSMADLVMLDDTERLSPLWNPARMARELGRPSEFSGTGHFVCVDGFGPTSAEERKAGLEGHGEAHRQTYEITRYAKEGSATSLTLTARLPIVQEQFTRTFRMVDGENVVYVESSLENLLGFDRPVNWAEHATIGSPFLEPGVTVVDLSGSRSQTRPYPKADVGTISRRLTSGGDFTWPMAPALDGAKVDLRATPTETRYLDHATTLLDPARALEWVTAINPRRRLLYGYVFKREEYPWLQYWGNYPPTGKLARGLEFGTQPYDVPRRESIGTGTMFDTPTYRWLPAKSKIGSRFLLFYVRVPEGFRKVDDVRLENGRIVIEDRAAKQSVTLAASLPL